MTDFTTMEHLKDKVSATYGAVLRYGDKVFVTDIFWRGGFTAEIYEFVDDPEESGFDAIECRLAMVDRSDRTFEDGGHAIAWCISQN